MNVLVKIAIKCLKEYRPFHLQLRSLPIAVTSMSFAHYNINDKWPLTSLVLGVGIVILQANVQIVFAVCTAPWFIMLEVNDQGVLKHGTNLTGMAEVDYEHVLVVHAILRPDVQFVVGIVRFIISVSRIICDADLKPECLGNVGNDRLRMLYLVGVLAQM